MDQVWSIFFINFFSALEGVEIAFLFIYLFFFFLLWAGGEGIGYRSWTCSLFFSHIQMIVVVGMHSRKEREGKEGRDLQV